MKNAISTFIAVISLLVLIWFVLSWGEITVKSLTDHPQYDDRNFFIVTMGD